MSLFMTPGKKLDPKLDPKDAEIERLKTEALSEKNSHYRSLQLWGEKEDRLKVIITELYDALDIMTQFLLIGDLPLELEETKRREIQALLQRAREATR